MNFDAIRVLLVEDDPDDVLLCRMSLQEADPAITLRPVGRLKEAVACLRDEQFDAAILDLSLPDSMGLATFAVIASCAPEVPIVVLSGNTDESLALKAVMQGAQDYLMKGDLHGVALARTVRYAIERKRTAEALRKSEEAHRTIFELAPVGITNVAPDGTILRCNPAMERMLGYEAGTLQGRDVLAIVHPADVEEAVRIRDALSAGSVESLRREQRYLRSDGSVMWGSLSVSTARDDSGQLLYDIRIVEDITDRVEGERQRWRAERLASLGTMVSGFAHELNNPLHAISNFAHLLIMDPRPPEDREALEIIRSEAIRAAGVVSDLRVFASHAKEQSGEQELVQVADLLDRVSRLGRYTLEMADVEVLVRVEPDLPPVLAVLPQLEQVLLNLLVNAEQAMAGQDRPKRINLRAESTRMGIGLHVIDTGPGIAPHHLDRVFDPFWTTKSPGQGTGLGLSMAHNIIAEHGGTIVASAHPDGGADFAIELPSAVSARRTQRPDAGRPEPSALRVLVVDDEAPIRSVLTRYLSRRGHLPDEACDGREALKLTEQNQYDAIISDLNMPEVGGREFLTVLRARGYDRNTRLIFVTGDVTGPEASWIRQNTTVPVLGKPVRLDEIARLLGASPAAAGSGVA